MEGTKPLDRLLIQGNRSTPKDESSIKKSRNKSLQLSTLPDKTFGSQFLKTFPQFRRYAYPDRETHSDYGSQMCANEPNETFLKIRGKTMYWDFEMNCSSANLSQINSQSIPNVDDSIGPDVYFEAAKDKVNQLNEHKEADAVQRNEEKSSRPIIIGRDSRLRHSYHRTVSLSLTGQKLTTPRDCDKNNEHHHPSDSLPALASRWEEPFSSRSSRQVRHERAETLQHIAPQRAVRSALLKQCLRIEKPRQSYEGQLATFVNDSNNVLSTPMSTKSPRGSAEATKHQFDHINSYVIFNQKNKIDKSAHQEASIHCTRSYGSANGHIAAKAKMDTRPNSFTSVKKFPNFNGNTDFKHLFITGLSPLGKTGNEREPKCSKDFTISNFKPYQEIVQSEEAFSNKDVGNSANDHDFDSDVRGPSSTCTPSQKVIQLRLDV